MSYPTSEATPNFSFEGAHLYRNVRNNQFVLAVEIRNRHIRKLKELRYLEKSLKGQYIMPGDYVILRNGRLSFVYGQAQFSSDHVLVC